MDYSCSAVLSILHWHFHIFLKTLCTLKIKWEACSGNQTKISLQCSAEAVLTHGDVSVSTHEHATFTYIGYIQHSYQRYYNTLIMLDLSSSSSFVRFTVNHTKCWRPSWKKDMLVEGWLRSCSGVERKEALQTSSNQQVLLRPIWKMLIWWSRSETWKKSEGKAQISRVLSWFFFFDESLLLLFPKVFCLPTPEMPDAQSSFHVTIKMWRFYVLLHHGGCF